MAIQDKATYIAQKNIDFANNTSQLITPTIQRTDRQNLAESLAWLSDTNTYTGQQRFNKGADVASATVLPLISDGNYFDVTGTVTVTSFADLGGAGTVIILQFDAACILTHHATNLILPTGGNITTAAGDNAIFVNYASGDYRCLSYQRADGTPLVGGGDVTKVGTPVNNQVGVWTGDGTLEGDSKLTFDGTTLGVTGGATFSGILTLGSTISNGTYTYTLPSATGTLALVGGAGVGTVTSVAAITLGTTGTDLSSTVATGTTTPVITLQVPTASAANRGALSSADWSTFNGKQGTITLTTTGTSGAATFIANTLNIPNYADGGVLSLSAIGGTANANGATITGTVLNLQPADASFGGVVTTGTQTFAGAKTLTGALSGTSASFAGSVTITGSNALRGSYGAGGKTTNFAAGDLALSSNTTGNFNTAIGRSALENNTEGIYNTATGSSALLQNTTASNNTATGTSALVANTEGSENTAIGRLALLNNTIGSNNTALGYQSGLGITTGSGNTVLGANVTGLAAGLTNNIILANGTGAIKAQHDGTDWALTGGATFSNNVEASTFSVSGAIPSTAASKGYFDYSGGGTRFFSVGTSGATKGAFTFIAKGADDSSITPLTITSGGVLQANYGISFPNQSAGSGTVSSSTLDAYEEGTWTPRLNQGGADVTPSQAIGTYIRIGKLLHISFYLYSNTPNSLSGSWVVKGLPYNLKSNQTNAYPFINFGYNSINGAVYTTGRGQVNTTSALDVYASWYNTSFTTASLEVSGSGTLLIA
jgi:hypothetical protein